MSRYDFRLPEAIQRQTGLEIFENANTLLNPQGLELRNFSQPIRGSETFLACLTQAGLNCSSALGDIVIHHSSGERRYTAADIIFFEEGEEHAEITLAALMTLLGTADQTIPIKHNYNE